MRRYTVRIATLEEQIKILAEPSLLAILLESPTEEDLREYLIEQAREYYILRAGSAKMLFEYWEKEAGSGIYEWHPAVPKASRLLSKYLVTLSFLWILAKEKDKGKKVRAFTTLVPKELKAIRNYCTNFGAIELPVTVAGKVVFLLPLVKLLKFKVY